MELKLYRKYKKATYTIGLLYVNNEFCCHVCEDTDRGLTQDMPLAEIKKRKVYSKTAIPTGTYKIAMNIVSPKFAQRAPYKSLCGGRVPRLLNVPGYEGILIHIGNSATQSAGCLLVGENTVVGKVMNSTETFKKLYKKLKEAADRGEQITITIE